LTSANALRSRSAIASAMAVLRRLSGSASDQLTHSAWIPSSALVACRHAKDADLTALIAAGRHLMGKPDREADIYAP
jgi:hypothetical protein